MSNSGPETGSQTNRDREEIAGELDALRIEVASLQASLAEAREVIALAERTRVLLEQQRGPIADPPSHPSPPEQHAIPPDLNPEPEEAVSLSQSVPNWLRSQRRSGEWQPRPAWVWDALVIIIILTVAGLARYWHLDTNPLGMQGDEAAAGLEARRILDEGWIGVFSSAASGNPTAFFYLTVPTVYALGNEILSVRLTSATIDMVTVLAVYVLLRRNFGFGTALVGSFLMAVSAWHIQYSRIAFMNILWPMLVVLGLIAFGEAHRSGNRIWFFLCGAFFASGIYAYNGHLLYLFVLGAFMALYLFGWRGLLFGLAVGAFLVDRGNISAIATAAAALIFFTSASARNWRKWLDALSFGFGFTLVFAAMADFMLTQTDRYFGRGRRVSLFNTVEWKDLDSVREQGEFLADRYRDFWVYLAHHPNPDYIAGFGSAAIVPVTAVALAVIGAALGLIRRNHPLVILSIMTLFLMPLAAISATDVSTDFALRRGMIMAPFFALLGGLAVVEIIRLCSGRGRLLKYGSVALSALLLLQIAYANLHGWFEVNSKAQATHWVLSEELVQTTEFLESLDDDDYVYFFSDRWPITHEVIRYLAGEQNGESRGARFGEDSIVFDPENGPGVVVLMGNETARLAEIQAKYPGGTVIESSYRYRPNDPPAFTAYLLPVPAESNP
jgi:4-amino-4-deoxy-L-arabinose transferase-like glycosyltransferase